MTRLLYRILIFIAAGQLLMSGLAIAQAGYTSPDNPPIAQPLVREGDYAVKLAAALKLGAVKNETEAENVLGAAGIEPRNGWIADYPVTPDIIGELQAAIAESAKAGKLAMKKDAALTALQDVTVGYGLSIKADASAKGSAAPGEAPPESPVVNNYYYDEGPPVVTYYAPPPDYAYLYTWVAYPFWWWDFWYPGYFILVDFHVGVYGRTGVFVTNHYRDVRTGGFVRIDPARRSLGGTLPATSGSRLSSPSSRSGATSILRSGQGRSATGSSKVLRGYGDKPSTGTRSSAFERSRNSRFDRAASDRGYQSRSNAGRSVEKGSGGQGFSRGDSRRDERSGFGGGGDGGGFHGRGR